MLNQIRDVVVINHRLDPHETELRILVEVEQLTPTTEIRGRLMGPRSVYTSTVEIAHPIRHVGTRSDAPQIELRVVITEASWWTPQSPFLYQGPLELWQDGELIERRQISHGIRSLQLTSKGLRLNGKSFLLRGKVVEPQCTETELRQWRDDGINVLLTNVYESRMEPGHWTSTDQFGLFVLEQTNVPSHFLRYRNDTNDHASVFGWVLHPGILDESAFAFNDRRPQQKRNFFGVASNAIPLPTNASFTLCTEEEFASRTEFQVPKIVLTKHLPDPVPTEPNLIGWIATA